MALTVIDGKATLTTTTATIYTVSSAAQYANISMIQIANSSAATAVVTVEWFTSAHVATTTLVPGVSVDVNTAISAVAGGMTLKGSWGIQAFCETTAASVDISIFGTEEDGT